MPVIPGDCGCDGEGCDICEQPHPEKELAKVEKKAQGKIVAQAEGDGRWLVAFPDGTVKNMRSKEAVTKAARAWFRRDLGDGLKIGVGVIEWRT